MEVRLLGQLEVAADDGSPVPIRGRNCTVAPQLRRREDRDVGRRLRTLAIAPDDLDVARFEGLVAELCRRLDHLPLALELAAAPAARVAVGATRRTARRSLPGADRWKPHRAAAAPDPARVVDWSHDLLFDDERRLFARLSVFTGGCGLDAAESVCADDALDRGDVLDLLSRLVDKSPVVADFDESGDVRYSQLQTLWEYGRERLADSGEADSVRDRHAQWHLDLSLQVREVSAASSGLVWRTRIAAELGSLRGALDW